MQERRTIIMARQNETVRRYAGEPIDLATMELQACIAVVITNEQGKASLTHIDVNTDLSFIKEEVKWLGPDAKISIIHSSDNAELAEELLNGNGRQFLPEESPVDKIETDTRHVLLKSNNRFSFPIRAQFELATEGVYMDTEKQQLRMNPRIKKMMKVQKYKEYDKDKVVADFGPEFALRDQIAQIESYFFSQKADPTKRFRQRKIVYDKGYLINQHNITIASGIDEPLEALRATYDRIDEDLFNDYLVFKFNPKEDLEKKIVGELAESLASYWEYGDRDPPALAELSEIKAQPSEGASVSGERVATAVQLTKDLAPDEKKRPPIASAEIMPLQNAIPQAFFSNSTSIKSSIQCSPSHYIDYKKIFFDRYNQRVEQDGNKSSPVSNEWNFEKIWEHALQKTFLGGWNRTRLALWDLGWMDADGNKGGKLPIEVAIQIPRLNLNIKFESDSIQNNPKTK